MRKSARHRFWRLAIGRLVVPVGGFPLVIRTAALLDLASYAARGTLARTRGTTQAILRHPVPVY